MPLIRWQVIFKIKEFDIIVGPESRGFIIGAPLAYAMQKGFIPVRKPGKLPGKPSLSVSIRIWYRSIRNS